MISENDSKNFKLLIRVTWQSFGRNAPDMDMMKYWWGNLIKYDFEVVTQAFDDWIKSQTELPTVKDIINLCKPKLTIHARLPSPLAIAENKRHADEVIKFVAENVKQKTDMKGWARNILDNPKGRPDIAIRYSKEALAQKEIAVA